MFSGYYMLQVKNANHIFFPDRGSNTVPPRRYKSQLVPQGSKGVLYTYTRWHIYSNSLCNGSIYGYLQYI